ncbi:MAG: hypothetical protein HOQ32_18335 [Lysobacter sp.]|nr:hypothetical protein [Lysobacter sp.]
MWDIVSPMGERITSYRQIDSSSCERTYDGGVLGGRGDRREGKGDGRERVPNDGDLNDDGRNPADTSMCRGNPIIVPTGNKIEPAQDFATYGQMPLFMSRTWNQQWDGVGLLGYHWLSNFDYRLSFNTRSPFGQAEGCYARPSLPSCSAPANNNEIWAHRPDGRLIRFVKNVADGIYYEDKPSPISKVVQQADGSWLLTFEDNLQEHYSSGGHPRWIQDEHGLRWTFAYGGLNGTQLQRVTHSNGRYIEFVWVDDELREVKDPAGSSYKYTYGNQKFEAGLHTLETVTLPGAPQTVITYLYPDAQAGGLGYTHLAGKAVNGVRYSWFSYQGSLYYAASTEHAGGVDRYSFTHTPGANGAMTVVETNPLGKQTTYKFNGGKLLQTTGHPSANCPGLQVANASFDANGYPDQDVDYKGNVTDYDYDASGRLLKTTRAAGKPEAQIEHLEWDVAKNRVKGWSIADAAGVVQYRERYTFAADGRLTSLEETNLSPTVAQSQNQQRVTTYSYTKHANGLLATMAVDGPLSADTVTSTYDAFGNLSEVRNGLGHATAYTNYNALGQAGRITGPNGDITEFSYDARGRPIARKTLIAGLAQTTAYAYDGYGRLASVQTPDGRKRFYEYDAAWRMVREYEAEGTGSYAVKRYTYNNASQVTSVVTERTTAVHPPSSAPTLTAPTTGANGAYTLSWTAVANAESYFLSESYNNGPWVMSYNGAALNYSFSGRPAGTYHHGITSCNAAGCAPPSPAQMVTVVYAPTQAPALTAPAQNTSGSYMVSWGSVSGATRYRLEESAGGAWSLVHDGAASSKAMVGKNAGAYSYRANACNAAGCGPLSTTVTVTEIDPPGAPPSLFAPTVNTNGNYTITWTAVAGSSSYQLEESINSGAWSLIGNDGSISRSFTGKASYLDHQYRVRACNSAGCGTTSAAVLVQHVMYGAQYVAQSVPSSIAPGQTASVTVQMRNTGNAPWTAADAYRLGSQAAVDNTNWGLNRVAVPGSVAPGEVATFSFTIVGPASDTGGIWYFQWRMVRDGMTWFGDQTPFTGIWLEGPDPNNCGSNPNCHPN